MATVDALPVEILRLVFVAGIETWKRPPILTLQPNGSFGAPQEMTVGHYTFAITAVCSQWRTIALALKKLWTRVEYDGSYLAGYKNVPKGNILKRLHLHLERFNPEPFDLLLRFLDREDRGFVKAVCDAIQPHLGRVRRVHWNGPQSEISNLVPQNSPSAMSQLQSVSIFRSGLKTRFNRDQVRVLQDVTAPRLRTLQLHEVRWELFSPPLECGIEEITANACSVIPHMAGWFPALENTLLDLGIYNPDDPGYIWERITPYTLHKLRRLRIAEHDLYLTNRTIDAPSLEELFLRGGVDPPRSPNWPSAAGLESGALSFPSLLSLRLIRTALSAPQLSALFSANISIEVLHLDGLMSASTILLVLLGHPEIDERSIDPHAETLPTSIANPLGRSGQLVLPLLKTLRTSGRYTSESNGFGLLLRVLMEKRPTLGVESDGILEGSDRFGERFQHKIPPTEEELSPTLF